MRVLVVEDEPVIRELACAILGSLGHDPTCCADGEEALELVSRRAGAFDLVIMDVAMPRLDGFEATRRLRAFPAAADLPVLCMSGHVTPADRREALEAGCDAFLEKPFRVRDLQAAMERAIAARPGRPCGCC